MPDHELATLAALAQIFTPSAAPKISSALSAKVCGGSRSAKKGRLHPIVWRRQPIRQQVSPHTPGAIGPVARQEAGADLRTKLFVAAAALTARACRPGIEATPRDTERLAHPVHGPDPPVLRNERELHVDSFAK